MLDRQAFAKELHALADRFNRSVSDEMTRRYYEDLQHLDTSTFLAAARVIYRQDQFWPPPNRFLEVAGVDHVSDAEAAWEQALAEASNGKALPLDAYEPAHRAALLAVGKNRSIGLAREDRLPFIKREFVRAYTQHRERGGLPELEKPDVPELPAGIVAKAMGKA